MEDEDEIQDDELLDEEPAPYPRWATDERTANQPVFVDTGRGNPVQVQVGDPFEATVSRIADDAHYGGYYRVYLNGLEVINPEDSPAQIEAGMRIAITSFDKVG